MPRSKPIHPSAPECLALSDDAFLVGVFDGTASAETLVFSENFQNTPTGPLGSPWSISKAGASTAVVVDTGDHGRVLELRGSTTLGDFLIASCGFSSSRNRNSVQRCHQRERRLVIRHRIQRCRSSLGSRRVRLQRAPGSTTLVAQTVPSGIHDCVPWRPASGRQ